MGSITTTFKGEEERKASKLNPRRRSISGSISVDMASSVRGGLWMPKGDPLRRFQTKRDTDLPFS